MIKFREPLSKLINDPKKFTKHLKFPKPDKIRIYDDTLRDGEQMPGVIFSPEQKLRLAKLLSKMGIHTMDVAFPVNGETDQKALKLCVAAQKKGEIRKDVEILAMCRSNTKDIDIVINTLAEIGAKPDDVSILVLSTISDLHIKYKLGRTLLRREGKSEKDWMKTPLEFYREANTALICDAIKYGKSKGINRIEFASEDSSRGNIEYGVKWAKACVKAGGTRMCFSDTCGVFTPESVDYYMGVTANGLGERAGNTSLHQTVMILKDLYGVEIPGFRYDMLHELRQEVEKASGICIQPHEPIIGEGVFAHESGIHTAGILIHPSIYQVIREEEVGGKRRFVFGKHSGAGAVEDVLKQNEKLLKSKGIEITDELIMKALKKVKAIRESTARDYQDIVDDYYKKYKNLGVSEEQLLELVLKGL